MLKLCVRYAYLLISFILLTQHLYAVEFPNDYPPGLQSYANPVVSISSDGHYALTSDLANQVVLWNLQNHTHQFISNHANIYSAYFIKHSHNFLWQTLGNYKYKFAITDQKALIDIHLAEISSNQLIVLWSDKGHYYLLYYTPQQGNYSTHVDKKLITNNAFNNYFIFRIEYDYMHPTKYDSHFNYDNDIFDRGRLMVILIKMGYQSGDIVHIQNVDGEHIKDFENFPVYSQIMSTNMQHYYASTVNWSLFSGIGHNQQLMMWYDGGFAMGKGLQLQLCQNKPYLLTVGMDDDQLPIVTTGDTVAKNVTYFSNHVIRGSRVLGPTLWNVYSNKPMKGFTGPRNQVYVTMDPACHYIVAGDDQITSYRWNITTGKQSFDQGWNIYYGRCTKWYANTCIKFDHSVKVPVPTKNIPSNGSKYPNFALKFIDKSHYLNFFYGMPYAALYSIKSSKPIKYFYLDKHPYPQQYDTGFTQSIDTSPSAHILVMAMASVYGGIIEYKYDPKKQTLKRIWVGHLPNAEVQAELKKYQQQHPTADSKSKTKDSKGKHWLHLFTKLIMK